MYKSVTIAEVAKRANVSTATVSRALNGSPSVKESTRKLILSIADNMERESNPSQEFRDKIILASFPDLSNPFYADIFKGISDAASARSYKVVFYSMDNHASKEGYAFFAENVFYAGLIIAHAVPDPHLLDPIRSRVPIVMCAEHNEGDIAPYVAIDDRAAAYNAVRYLISSGRTRISMINTSLRHNYATHREAAFRECLRDHGLPIREEWITHLSEVNYNLGLTAAAQILSGDDRPDAFFCVSDVFAAAAINVGAGLGISIPKDLAVVGFDNIDIAAMTVPAITTVAQPTYQIGAQACQLLIDQLEYHTSMPRQIILNTELILRNST